MQDQSEPIDEVYTDAELMRRVRAGEWSTVRAEDVSDADLERAVRDLRELGFLD